MAVDTIKYTLLENRRLKRANRERIIETDHNMVRLDIYIPNIVNGVDVTGFDYVVKFDVDDEYVEMTPTKELLDDIKLSVMITEEVTRQDGIIRFSITGNTTDKRFSSAIATENVGDTITVGEYKTVEILDKWLEEIRSAVNDAKQVINETLGDKVGEYLRNLELDYNVLANIPQIETVELKGNKTFEELGFLEITEDDIERMF